MTRSEKIKRDAEHVLTTKLFVDKQSLVSCLAALTASDINALKRYVNLREQTATAPVVDRESF